MIDAKIKKHLERALRGAYEDDAIVYLKDEGFEFGIPSNDCAVDFIDALMEKMTIEEKGDFIQEYMLNLSVKEAGMALAESLTSSRINPLRALAIDCAEELLSREESQSYLSEYRKTI